MNRVSILLGVGLVGSNGIPASLRLWRKYRNPCRLDGLEKIDLLPAESAPVCMGVPATSTVTFYRGSWQKTKEYLDQRVNDIVQANPWLSCHLDFDAASAGAVALYRNQNTLRNHFFVRDDISFSRGETNYASMANVLESAFCKKGYESVGNDELLWKVSIVPDSREPEARFAVVVSANHNLVDGHGFYRLYNMLSSTKKVEVLDPVRRKEMSAKIHDAMDGEASIMTVPPAGFIVRMCLGLAWNSLFPRTKSLVFEVSDEWIASQKESAIRDGEVPYISTNDAIVSAYWKCFKPPLTMAMMPVNFRNRVPGLDDDAMGNYEEMLPYMPPDFATPALIRKSISGAKMRRAAQPPTSIPPFWRHITAGSYCESLNWASFATPLDIEGASEELHLPVVNYPELAPASVFSSMIIFRPRPGKVGVTVGGSAALLQTLAATGMVGESLGVIND